MDEEIGKHDGWVKWLQGSLEELVEQALMASSEAYQMQRGEVEM